MRLHSHFAAILSILLGGIFIVGLTLLFCERSYWWSSWLRERVFYWIAMLSVVAVAALVIPTQRPRPSYLFTVSLFLMAVTGMCVFALSRRWPALRRLSAMMPAVMLLSPLLIPSYYLHAGKNDSRQLLKLFRRLEPYGDVIAFGSTKLLLEGYTSEILYYVAHDGRESDQRSATYAIFEHRPEGMPLDEFLAQQGIGVFYVANSLWSVLEKNPSDRKFLEQPDAAGWERIGLERSAQTRWMLLRKKSLLETDPVMLKRLNAVGDIGPRAGMRRLYSQQMLSADGLFLGTGRYNVELQGEKEFRAFGFRWQ